MIVVAIIGLLAAIAIPSFQKARQGSHLVACLNNLRTYQDVLEQYAFESSQYPSDINDLVTQGYLKELIQCPVGGAYAWSVSNGNQDYHLVCNAQHTPSSNHVCIHEDQRPKAK
jgi:type II secretory pathway pseudopilin PulG